MFKACLVSGAVGVLLGISITCAVNELSGSDLTTSASPPSGPGGEPKKDSPMMAGPGGSGCPMMSGANAPRPQRDLITVVQELNLLTGDIGITLSAEQAARVDDCLKDVEKSARISDDDAKAKHDQLMAVLNENQKQHLEAIDILRPAMGCPMEAAMRDRAHNPFQQDDEGKALKSLRERLASKATAPRAETPKASPAKTETPKAPPPNSGVRKSPVAKP